MAKPLHLDEHNAKLELIRLDEHFPEPVLLIGGLAVKFYHRGRNSKDLDIVCNMHVFSSIEATAYPTASYDSISSQSDIQPKIIYRNLQTGVKIYLGPKITDRQPYKFISYDDYFSDAQPYKYKDVECTNIFVPSPHHLAFSKLISAISRKGTEKGLQDLRDFANLSNNKKFSLNHFLNYIGRVKAETHIESFLLSLDANGQEVKLLQSSSIHRGSKFLASVRSTAAELISDIPTAKGSLESIYDQFVNVVVNTGKGRSIHSIKAIVHTGQVSVRTIAKLLERTTLSSDRVQILMRAPEYEDYFRNTASRRAIEDIRDFGFQHQFYSAPPMMHGILVRYEDGFECFAYSFYVRSRNGKTRISNQGFLQVGMSPGLFAPQFDNWFTYHWGKSDTLIHTVVFDFDDTLADTGFVQVCAWCDAIKKLKDHRKQFLREEIKSAAEAGDLEALMLERFSTRQTADQIATSIFEKNTPADTAAVLKAEIHKSRLEVRLKRTLDAKLFPNVLETLATLADDYYLAIVSATDEKIVRKYLRKRGVLQHFSHVYGKHAPYEDWSEHIAIKSQNLIKMASILGIPLNRMVYVGDSNGDFLASSQVGVPFIEARLEKERLGGASLIKSGAARVVIEEFGDLISALEEISPTLAS